MIDGKGLDPKLVLELQRTMELLDTISLEELEKEIADRATKIDRLVEDVKLGEKWERRLHKKKGPGRPKLHWKTRIARRAATKAKYYQNTWKPRRQRELAEELRTPEGWYVHITRQWKGEKMTLEEWTEHLWPKLQGRVPVFKRDDTKKGWTLDNVCMYESRTGVLISSSEDYKLKALGYAV